VAGFEQLTARPALTALQIADPPERWQALGFAVDEDTVHLGGVRLELGVNGYGIVGWSLDAVETANDVAGLATTNAPPAAPQAHPNGAIALDHVVVLTPDFDRTAAALDQTGLTLTRIRDAGGFRQGFRRLGPAILELVEAPGTHVTGFWGLVVTVADLDDLAKRLGGRLHPIKPAVQPGRRIATLDQAAGLTPQVAFMDPESA
jgi:hypothetical protein